jgi:hypothetical protein
LCPLVSAVLARGLRAEIPRFFVAQLFFRKSATMDTFTIRVYERKGSFGTAVAPLHQPALQL